MTQKTTRSFKVIATIVSQQGYCAAGHQVGDRFEIGDLTPCGFCAHAYQAIFPFAMGMQYGACYPWDQEPDHTTLACPDPDNPVHIELRRIPISDDGE